jgi:hypothetical protein
MQQAFYLKEFRDELRAPMTPAQNQKAELQAQWKTADHLTAVEKAALEVAIQKNHITSMLSVHRAACNPVDWHAILKRPEPAPPIRQTAFEDLAEEAWFHYEPGWLDKFMGRARMKRRSLHGHIERARRKDDAIFEEEKKPYLQNLQKWRLITSLARGILEYDTSAYRKILELVNPFSDLIELGSRLSFKFVGSTGVEVDLHVHSDRVIPRKRKFLSGSARSESGTGLKTQKLIRTEYYASEDFFAMYQDYVCSCVLRVARDLFSLLPLDAVLVSALDVPRVNTSTGGQKEQCILSVLIPRQRLATLNMDLIDPSDSMANFEYRMSYSPYSGFSPVERLTIDS